MLFLNIVQQFILPSFFIPLIIGLGLFLTFRNKSLKKGRYIILFGLMLYYLFSITPITDILLIPLEREYKVLVIEETQDVNNIVVLLGGRESDVLRFSEVLRIAHLTEQRVKIIVSGTDSLGRINEEAPAVRNFFISRGVPAENIIIEGRSKNTRENVRNVVEIIREEPFFLVTSAFHMNRAMMEFKEHNANPIPAPTDFRVVNDYTIFSYLPSARDLRNSDLAIHEHIGTLLYNIL